MPASFGPLALRRCALCDDSAGQAQHAEAEAAHSHVTHVVALPLLPMADAVEDAHAEARLREMHAEADRVADLVRAGLDLPERVDPPAAAGRVDGTDHVLRLGGLA